MLSDTMMLGGGRKAAYSIENSLLFRGGQYLKRTPSISGNGKLFTISMWFRQGKILSSGRVRLFSTYRDSSISGNAAFGISIEAQGNLSVASHGWGDNPTNHFEYVTSRKFADPSAWYHLVVHVDIANQTAADRVRIYVNGARETQFLVQQESNGTQSTDMNRAGIAHFIGRYWDQGWGDQQTIDAYGFYYDGEIAEMCVVDGQALSSSDFGELDSITGSWRPKKLTGITWGVNGFYLGKPWVPRPPVENVFSFNGGIAGGLNSAGYTIRNVFSPAAFSSKSGKQVRVRFDASVAGYTIAAAYIGKRAASGNAWDFDGNQVRLKFGGSNSGSVGANSSVYSDFATIDIDGASDYVIAIDCGANATNVYGAGSQFMPSAVSSFCKVSGTEAGVTAPSDFISPGGMRAITAIEIVPKTHFGTDYSGQGNTWTPSGFTTTDVVKDTPTNVYCTVSKLANYHYYSSDPVTDGGLTVTHYDTGDNNICYTGTNFAASSGKFYLEMTCGATGTYMGYPRIGMNSDGYPTYSSLTWVDLLQSQGAGVTSCLAIDFDTGKYWRTFGQPVNVTQAPTGTISVGRLWWLCVLTHEYSPSTVSATFNFGQRAYAYAPPAGFNALCSANLAATAGQASGSFPGNASTDGPCVYTRAVPLTLTVNGNAVTWGVHADKLATGFKIRTASGSYNGSGSNSLTATYDRKPTVGPKGRAPANAQTN